nr:chorion class B protein PC401-like [Danaus plexippus plexippus]
MSSKIIVLCVQAFFIQNIFGQCIGNVGSNYNLGNCDVLAARRSYDLPNCGSSNAQWAGAQLGFVEGLTASSGGGLNVQTSSPFAPGSLSILSENQIQGPVEVSGTLPFLSAVAFEGSLPTRGSGEVLYQCGNGRVGILEENNQISAINSGILGGNSGILGGNSGILGGNSGILGGNSGILGQNRIRSVSYTHITNAEINADEVAGKN